jgi:hypothetical protein
MLMRTRWLAVGLAVAVVTPGTAGAHHGWSGYQAASLVTLTGTVESISYTSPHATLTLEADGKLWEVVLAPPSRMQRRGLPDGSIVAGAEATVEGYPHRSETSEFRAERILLNGASYELR